MNFDTPSLLRQQIEDQITKAIAQLPISYPCEVKSVSSEKKGFVEVQKLIPQTINDTGRVIPVIQSPYFTLPIKEGDIGIALNCSYIFEKVLGGEKIERSLRSNGENGLFFIPLVPSSEIENDLESTTLTDQDKQNKIILSKDKITACIGKKEVVFDDSKVDFGVKIAQGKSPIDITGAGGDLYKAFEIMISLMDLLASGMAGSGTNAGAYNGGKQAQIELLKKIVKG